jgi:hypothetical protein
VLSLEVGKIFRVGYTINSTTAFTKAAIITNSSAVFSISAVNTCSGIEKLNAGDIIRFAVAHDNAAATSLTNDGRFQTYTIERLSGPATIAASETVSLSYENTAGTLVTGSPATIPFSTKKYDSHSAYNGTTFTAPISGKYRITGMVTIASIIFTTAQQLFFDIFKNGSFLINGNNVWGNGVGTDIRTNGSVTVSLVAGDQITISAQQTTGVSRALFTGSGFNFLMIERIGN